MKHYDFFKYDLDVQNKFSSLYAREAVIYQSKYNRKHPDRHIWRHLLYRRTFYFFLNGRYISAQIEIVRFRHAGTNRTFTFYGTLFCPYSHFSSDFIKQAVSGSKQPDNPAALTVSVDTLKCWKTWLLNGRGFSPEIPAAIRT